MRNCCLAPLEENHYRRLLSVSGMMRLDHVFAFFSHHGLSRDEADILLRYWHCIGWIQTVITLRDEPAWVIISEQMKPSFVPSLTQEALDYLYTLNAVRLVMALDIPSATWTQAEIGNRTTSMVWSQVDAEVRLTDGTVIAILVDVTTGSVEDLRARLLTVLMNDDTKNNFGSSNRPFVSTIGRQSDRFTQLRREEKHDGSHHYERLWYFASARIAHLVERQRSYLLKKGQLTSQQGQAFHIYALYPEQCIEEITPETDE